MARIARPETAFSIQPGKQTKPVKRKPYRDWIKTLPCMLAGTHGNLCEGVVDPAHLSTRAGKYGHFGRGKQSKASDRWVLPLCRLHHDQQHDHKELTWWSIYNRNPYVACLVLWGLWSDLGEDATEIATKLILERELG